MEQTASPSALDAEDPLEVMAPFGRLVHLTSFIGREHEIAWVRGRLESGQRLLTITGPGGVGKTRLAMAVAGSIDTRAVFTDGVVVVEMAPVADQTLVLPTIARALGVVAEDQGNGAAVCSRYRLRSCRRPPCTTLVSSPLLYGGTS